MVDLSQLMGALGPLQEQMKKADAERTAATIDGRAGAGSSAVTVRLKGDLSVQAVTIALAAVGDVAMLEDLVLVAVNDALRQYRTRFGASPEEQMQKLMSGGGAGLLGPLLGGLGR